MSTGHFFDYYLSQTEDHSSEQNRTIGNSLLGQAKKAAGEWQDQLAGLWPSSNDLSILPDGSWLLRFVFRLARPFTSKSEAEFHHYEGQHEVQNPIVRDHLTGLPMVRPTTWKGHLRFAARMVHGVADKNQEPEALKRLFGETRGDEGGVEGRLRFFPTFFTGNVQREVITPLKRDTRTPARGPIGIEVAPAGAEGTFCLLYLPIPGGQHCSPAQLAEDLEAIAGALRSMFLEYGFSAKKTAGWGLVKDNLEQEGHLWAKGEMWPQEGEQGIAGAEFQEPAPEWLLLMDAAGNPVPQLLKPDGSFLSNTEYPRLAEKPVSGNVYRRFRNWHSAHGEEWRRRQSGAARASRAVREYTFPSVSGLEVLFKKLAEALHQEGANE